MLAAWPRRSRIRARGYRSRSASWRGLLLEKIAGLDEKIRGLEKDVHTSARQDEEAVRLMTIPGVGPITAMALQAFAPPKESFRRGRDGSAWLGQRSKAAHDRRQAQAGQDIQDGPARTSGGF